MAVKLFSKQSILNHCFKHLFTYTLCLTLLIRVSYHLLLLLLIFAAIVKTDPGCFISILNTMNRLVGSDVPLENYNIPSKIKHNLSSVYLIVTSLCNSMHKTLSLNFFKFYICHAKTKVLH